MQWDWFAPVKLEIVGKSLENRVGGGVPNTRGRPDMGIFSILRTRDLEIYLFNPPEICVGVAPHALVCAKKFWCDGVALRARNLEKT